MRISSTSKRPPLRPASRTPPSSAPAAAPSGSDSTQARKSSRPPTPPPRRLGLPDRRAMERLTREAERFVQASMFESLDEVNAALRQRFSGPIDDIPSTAATPLEKAQDLIYTAFEARGRRRVQLARRALELSADCADAYVVLAEESRSPDEARALYEKAVAAGERALGPQVFAEEAGHFR